DRARQRLRVRARYLDLDARPRARPAHRAPDGERDGLAERPHVLARALRLRVGRREALGSRARALEVRLLRVRERQAGRLGAVAYAQLLVAPVRPLAPRGDGLGG